MIKVLTVALMQDSLLQGSQSSTAPLLLYESDSAANAFMAWSLLLQITLSYLLCLHACTWKKKQEQESCMGLFLSLFLSFQIWKKQNPWFIPSFFRWIYEKTSIKLNPKLASWHAMARQGNYILIFVHFWIRVTHIHIYIFV